MRHYRAGVGMQGVIVGGCWLYLLCSYWMLLWAIYVFQRNKYISIQKRAILKNAQTIKQLHLYATNKRAIDLIWNMASFFFLALQTSEKASLMSMISHQVTAKIKKTLNGNHQTYNGLLKRQKGSPKDVFILLS